MGRRGKDWRKIRSINVFINGTQESFDLDSQERIIDIKKVDDLFTPPHEREAKEKLKKKASTQKKHKKAKQIVNQPEENDDAFYIPNNYNESSIITEFSYNESMMDELFASNEDEMSFEIFNFNQE